MHVKAIEKLELAFKEVDMNSDHKIDWDEIQACCTKLNIKLEEHDYHVFLQSDSSADDRLNFDEFCNFINF